MDDRADRREVSRRVCLRVLSTGLATGLVAAAGSFLAGCRGDEAFACTDTAMLSASERAARDALKYMDRGIQQERRCLLCVQYELPSKSGACGGCKIIKGPIHPSGSCLAWAARG